MVVVNEKKGRILPSVVLPQPSTKALILLTLLLAGCGKITASIQEDTLPQTGERVPRVIWSASARLRPVDGAEGGAGFIEVNAYDNRTVVPAIRLHLPEAESGWYEAWLLSDNPVDKVNLGSLIQTEHGGFRLGNTTIIIEEDFKRYKTVVITYESKQEGKLSSQELLRGPLTMMSGLNIEGEKVLLQFPF